MWNLLLLLRGCLSVQISYTQSIKTALLVGERLLPRTYYYCTVHWYLLTINKYLQIKVWNSYIHQLVQKFQSFSIKIYFFYFTYILFKTPHIRSSILRYISLNYHLKKKLFIFLHKQQLPFTRFLYPWNM